MGLRSLFAQAVRKSLDATELHGRLGLPDPDNEGQYFFEIEGYPEYYHYVRIIQGGASAAPPRVSISCWGTMSIR